MRLGPEIEGKRWFAQAEWDMDDAEYAFVGRRFNLVFLGLNRQPRRR